MKRASALSITFLLLWMAPIAPAQAPDSARYHLLSSDAKTAPASRYRVSRAPDEGLRLLGVDTKAGVLDCESADELFAHGFEN